MLCYDYRRRQHQTKQKDLWLLDMFLERGTSVKILISPIKCLLSLICEKSRQGSIHSGATLWWATGWQVVCGQTGWQSQGQTERTLAGFCLDLLTNTQRWHTWIFVLLQPFLHSPAVHPLCMPHALRQRADTPHSFLVTPCLLFSAFSIERFSS